MMQEEVFRFKEFSVAQNEQAHKVGTEGVLLGAWTDCANAKTILDIGTGTGLLALMMAQKNKNAKTTAVEIDEESARLAEKNFSGSPWKNRMEVFAESIFDFKPRFKFDLIICNPPFFTNSLKSPKPERNKARHNDVMLFDKLLKKVNELLSEDGKFSAIIPFEDEKEFVTKAWFEKLYHEKICRVKPKENSGFKRSLILFGKKQGCTDEEEIIIESDKFRQLTAPFYL